MRLSLLLLLCGFFTSGCFATYSELQKERKLREALEDDLKIFKKEQRAFRDKIEAVHAQERSKMAAEIARLQAENAKTLRTLEKLDGQVKTGQGGVAEMFTTLQALQTNFQKSLGQVEELQQQIRDMLQKQPDQDKRYEEVQKKYEELLKNQKSLAEQAIPAKLFARGRDAYKAEKYDEAMEVFKTFAQQFGSHPLADNAWLYIGDIHRKRDAINDAILAYTKIIQTYPNESEAPNALFRLGLLHYKRGLCRQGKKYFQQLMRFRRQEAKLAAEAEKFFRGSAKLCKPRRG